MGVAHTFGPTFISRRLPGAGLVLTQFRAYWGWGYRGLRGRSIENPVFTDALGKFVCYLCEMGTNTFCPRIGHQIGLRRGRCCWGRRFSCGWRGRRRRWQGVVGNWFNWAILRFSFKDIRTVCYFHKKIDKPETETDSELHLCSDAASGWAGWALAFPEFGSSVNPIPTRRQIMPITSVLAPGFENVAASLLCKYS